MSKIYGNTESVKQALIEYMESFVGNVYDAGEFLPSEILDMMRLATVSTQREIALFMDRRNRVAAISIGDATSAPLEGFSDIRRGEKRLSGIRLWHTHPNGTTFPSDVDIASLKDERFDACGVIGVNTEKETVTGITATLLQRNDEGKLENTLTYGPVLPSNKEVLNELFNEIRNVDKEAGDGDADEVDGGAERAILVGVILPEDNENKWSDEPLSELAELARAAGAEVVYKCVQKRQCPNSKYYIGKGLAEELALKRQSLRATLVIVDDELSASTIKNLEEVIGARVIDRTTLILDIFALRAKSSEGRLQVELAQQKYRLPRLMGLGTSLSRLGGGIGTRGPGESKLTSDRNHIRRRIAFLEEELRKVETNRGVIRKEREKNGVPVACIVGYTNAGKSTLINNLCNADVFAQDMLFATLDPSVRKLRTQENRDFLLIDTVGFIKKLPHDLVEAFKSTLEELKFSDLLLHVVDGSSPYAEDQIRVVENLIEELGAGEKEQFVVVNKIDKTDSYKLNVGRLEEKGYKVFYTSAREGTGLDDLKQAIVGFFSQNIVPLKLLLPYNEGALLSYIHDNGTVTNEEYTDKGVFVEATIDEKYMNQAFKKYEV